LLPVADRHLPAAGVDDQVADLYRLLVPVVAAAEDRHHPPFQLGVGEGHLEVVVGAEIVAP
jgi:hypothetical protein